MFFNLVAWYRWLSICECVGELAPPVVQLPPLCSTMQSFHGHQARAGKPEVDIPDGVAAHATTFLVFSDDQLDEVRALLVQPVLAVIFVHFIGLEVAALELGETLEAHRGVDAELVAGRSWR